LLGIRVELSLPGQQAQAPEGDGCTPAGENYVCHTHRQSLKFHESLPAENAPTGFHQTLAAVKLRSKSLILR